MITRRSSRAVLYTAVVLALFASGCAKRPAETQAAAPAPTGAPVAVAPAPAPAPAPVAPAPAPAPPAPAPAPVAPAPAPAETARPAPATFAAAPDLPDIYFDFDKSAIRPDAAKILQSNADWLKANTSHVVLIEGHCDERGTPEYNMALGDRRAKAARDFLVAQGVAGARINVISYGEERPQCKESNEECWSRNRRAHFVVKPQ
jgi:peptidoglycan-associated lipoprotein